ncbi:MAG: hypothetical protein KC619_19100 [Myxococcales bacterium]|nr:hypothetical protein [Myxococcales bacterium]
MASEVPEPARRPPPPAPGRRLRVAIVLGILFVAVAPFVVGTAMWLVQRALERDAPSPAAPGRTTSDR